jgi:starch phosphorylase
MKPLLTYTVAPRLPERIARLKELSMNFWWTWNAKAKSLFESIHPELWQQTHHNPVMLLKSVPQTDLMQLAADPGFCERLDAVLSAFDSYMRRTHAHSSASALDGTVAYFCAEFGITECFQNYSGGLGVLAGDHLKTASDRMLPLVGVGLLYQQGYFHQYLSENGWQSEKYADVDFSNLPLELINDGAGAPLVVNVELPKGPAYAQIWCARVGSIPLYLLDTNISMNDAVPEYRDITDQLYGGTTETRIMQEMILGIGGMRALAAMGISPDVLHVNEGHAAFCSLERTRMLKNEFGIGFAEALEATRSGGCFTTHTPVPAGNEIFTVDLMKHYFSRYYPTLGISEQELLDLGRLPGGSDEDGFSMTVLGLKTSVFRNGVSELHGAVARDMWKELWPHMRVDEVPIRGVTNGVHVMTWVSKEFADVYAQTLGEAWHETLTDNSMWNKVRDIPDEVLWRTHERRRRILVDRVREHVRRKDPLHISEKDKSTAFELLHPHTFTIGFARRFATYKRSDLMFRNMERLMRLLCSEQRPVQILIAGKAHPRDIAGKEIMHRIITLLKKHDLERRVVFLEDYDMDIAKALVKGVDIWLNTPRRPYEASGTSGMKAALNGVLHCSVPDGWWAEAYDGSNGFSIGRGEEYPSADEQDMIESELLYHMLETMIVPAFYERDDRGVPRRWMEWVKNSIATNAGRFSSARMLDDYVNFCYVPSAQLVQSLLGNNAENAVALYAWRQEISQRWQGVHVRDVVIDDAGDVHVGKTLRVQAVVETSGIDAQYLHVELCHGTLDAHGRITNPSYHTMHLQLTQGSSICTYTGEYECTNSGSQGVNIRVSPSNALVPFPQDLNLVQYAQGIDAQHA